MAHVRTGKGVPNMLWYKKRPQESEALATPLHSALISGQAAFIALALRLQVRLVSYADNLAGGIDHITAGAGLSSMASSSYQDLGVDVRGQKISLARSYQTSAGAADPRGFVTKKLKSASDMSDSQQLEALTNEMRILAHSTIGSHPNIVQMLCLAWDELPNQGRYWPRMILEYADRGNLADYFKDKSRLTDRPFQIHVTVDVLKGLNVLHRHDVVHGDLKCANILLFLGPDDNTKYLAVRAKLCDFGHSIMLSDYSDRESKTKMMLGTPPWNAPELLFGYPTRIRDLTLADIYSFGLVLGQIILRGVSPFQHLTQEEIDTLKGQDTEQDLRICELIRQAVDTQNDRHGFLFDQIFKLSLHPKAENRAAIDTIINVIFDHFGILSDELSGLRRDAAAPKIDPIPKIRILDSEDQEIEETPDFEFKHAWLPSRLSKQTRGEIFRDFNEQANMPLPDRNHRRQESSYQLAVCFFQGIGTAKDRDAALSWLRKAATLGHQRALAVSRNIYDGLNLPFPEDFPRFAARDLRQAAISELRAFDKWYERSPALVSDFAVMKAWIREDKAAYKAFAEGDDRLEQGRDVFFAHPLRLARDLTRGFSAADAFEFNKLSTYTMEKFTKFSVDRSLEFVAQVRSLECVNLYNADGITLLQHAALCGDLPLTRSLVEELGAELDGTGAIGITPLWLSCLQGSHEVAVYLLKKGADPFFRDQMFGKTIAHFLSRFNDKRHVMPVLVELTRVATAIGSYEFLNVKDIHGLKPLLAAFVGWDYLDGFAQHSLLFMGAQPDSVASKHPTPLSLCLRNLDADVLDSFMEKMLPNGPEDAFDNSILKMAKSDTFQQFQNYTEFDRLAVVGKDYRTRLGRIVKSLAHSQPPTSSSLDEAFGLLGLGERTKKLSPLVYACSLNQDDLIEAVLDNVESIDVNEFDSLKMTALLRSVEAGNFHIITRLLKQGANPLLTGGQDLTNNAFCAAALHCPSLMRGIVEVAEQVTFPWNESRRNARELLEISNRDGFTPFDLAVIEGTKEHLECAEQLQARFNLDYDSIKRRSLFALNTSASESTTLLGYLVQAAAFSNAFSFPSIEYLLSLQPQPRFICSSSGSTLFMAAAGGGGRQDGRPDESEQGGEDTSGGSGGSRVIEALLEAYQYPELMNLPDNNGSSAIHVAAYWSNITAIRLFSEHMQAHGQELLVNLVDDDNHTPLDVIGQPLVYQLSQVAPIDIDGPNLAHWQYNTAELYKRLRRMGAKKSSEPESAISRVYVMTQNKLSHEQYITFMRTVSSKHGIIWKDEGGRVPAEDKDTIHSASMVELGWNLDHFILRGREVMTSRAQAYINLQKQKMIRLVQALNVSFTEDLWMKNSYTERFCNMNITWERPGKVWATREWEAMFQDIDREWFGPS